MITTVQPSKGKYRFALILAAIASLLTAAALVIPAGSLDPTFGKNGVAVTDLGSDSDSAGAPLLRSDGKFFVTASASVAGTDPIQRTQSVLRYNSNGSLDASFGTNGRVTAGVPPFSVCESMVQPDGKLVVAGQSRGTNFAVARYTTAGSLDTSFGTNGIAAVNFSIYENDYCQDAAIQPDGGILVAGFQDIGNYTYFVLARFDKNGAPDTAFNLNVEMGEYVFPDNRYDYGSAIAVQADGRIIMSGVMIENYTSTEWTTLVRFNADGTLDHTFGAGGGAKANIPNFVGAQGGLVVQPDGKILVAGISFLGDSSPTNDLELARFNADGSLDTTLGGSGFVVTDFGSNERASDLAVEPGGRIAVIGTSDASGANRLLLAQYNADGSLDTSFGTGGRVLAGDASDVQLASGIAVQPDGRILVAGAGNGNAALARFTSTSRNATLVTVTLRSQGINDGWLLESDENSNVAGWFDKLGKTFQVGDNPKDRQSRGLLSFNTASLPDTAVITSAQVNLKKQGIVGTNPLTTHGPLLLEVRSGSFSNNLALQLSDFSAPVSPGAISEQVSLFAPEWYRATLSSGNLALINRTGMTQFRLRFTRDDNDDMSADYLKFFSGNADLASQPQLIITYYVP